MADWVWVESPGTALTEEPKLRTSVFGDGYEQSAPDGINALAQKWSYQAVDVDDSVGNDMVAFLRAHADGSSFNYVPLWETVPIKVKARSWQRTLGSAVGLSNLSATFEQVFEP